MMFTKTESVHGERKTGENGDMAGEEMIETMAEEALELLKQFTEAHGAPGREEAVRRLVRECLRAAGCAVTVDKTGNILCRKQGTAARPRIMLAAHMDEVGFAVQSIGAGGLIKFVTLGGWWAHTLLAQRVRILTRTGVEVPGVVGSKPPHFLGEGERDKLLKFEDMVIDVGAASAEEVRSHFGVDLGDPIVPDSSFTPLGKEGWFMGKAFDDRTGLALMVHTLRGLAERSHPNVIVGVGTVQEEVGVRGAQTAAYSADPDAAIVLEGTPADDLPGIPEDERQGVPGRGVQIRLMDPSAIMNRDFARLAMDLAASEGIPHQVAVRRSGGTDAKAIHLHGAGVPTIVLGVPARYIHTHSGILCLDDYMAALRLALKLVEVLDARTVEGFTAFGD